MKKLFFALSLFTFAPEAKAQKIEITFEQHVKQLKAELKEKGHDPKILDTVFDGKFVQSKAVSKALKNQPEVKFSFNKYVDGKLSDWRVSTGRKYYKEHYETLKQIGEKYKVDPAVVVALWGIETNYGTYPMKHNAIKALVNMSYTHKRPHRRDYFKKELFDAIEVTERFNIAPLELRGSWAGALGQCQFMPSNVLKYAVDGNNDGKVDIWNTQEDVFASAANFINILGWQDGIANVREVSVPPKYNILAKRVYKPISQWRAEGVFVKNKANSTDKLKMFAPRNKDNKVFLVSKNFDVIKRWNNSDYFAYSVLELAEQIKNQ